MFKRLRSYTSYSEENGKLVPSIEPQANNQIEEVQKPKPLSENLKQLSENLKQKPSKQQDTKTK